MQRKSGIFKVRTNDQRTINLLGGDYIYYAFKADGSFSDMIYVFCIETECHVSYTAQEAKKLFQYYFTETINKQERTEILKKFVSITGYELD